jgi:hypothetical protein
MAAEADEIHRRPLDKQRQPQYRLDTDRPFHERTWSLGHVDPRGACYGGLFESAMRENKAP